MNLLRDLPDARAAEFVETLISRPGMRIERIVSLGQARPPGFWYDQGETEWIVLLAGAARLRFQDEPETRHLGPGDWVEIALHRRHRVEWTDPDRPTVWLAVFYREERELQTSCRRQAPCSSTTSRISCRRWMRRQPLSNAAAFA